jgi:hypothetical protein
MRKLGSIILSAVVLILNSSELLSSAETSTQKKVAVGQILGSDSQPISGASVSYDSESGIRGVITDNSGRFLLLLPNESRDTVLLTIRSLGYHTRSKAISLSVKNQYELLPLIIVLTESTTELAGMTVTSPRDASKTTQQSDQIVKRARQSLVPTNVSPTLIDPHLSRAGSMHSGQVRLAGTNPVYELNGQSIGQDPNHFEALTLIPSSALSSTEIQSLGTSVMHRQLAAIGLNAHPTFNGKNKTEVQASTVEMTGTSRFSGANLAATVSLRQSVINQVLGDFSANGTIKSIPPTNFTDLFFSAAYRINRHATLSFDQFAGTDQLEFNTSDLFDEPTAGKVDLNQKSTDIISLLKLHSRGFNSHWSVGVSRRSTDETYVAVPQSALNRLSLDLEGTHEKIGARAEAGWNLSDATEIESGFELETVTRQDITLSQSHWNFLPPFWNTDAEHPYQSWLNSEYAEIDLSQRSQNAGISLGGSTQLRSSLQLEAGARGDYFSELQNGAVLSYRLRAKIDLGNKSTLQLFHGTSSESPVSGLLEPYQVIIRDQVTSLTPIHSSLSSASLSKGRLTFSLYQKWQDNLPVFLPANNASEPEHFLQMKSIGSTRFWGGAVNFSNVELFSPKLTADLSYTYSQAWKYEAGTFYPHELHSPHRLEGGIQYAASRRLNLAGSFMVRSGYPYSPIRIPSSSRATALDPSIYEQTLVEMNSNHFPVHGYMNLYGEYSFGNTVIFGSISNLTNRANALVHHPRGFLYDTSLLPTFGVKFSF